jgi:hypothetical protein
VSGVDRYVATSPLPSPVKNDEKGIRKRRKVAYRGFHP